MVDFRVLYIVAAYLSLNSEDVVRAILNAFTQQQGGNTAVSAAAAAGTSAEPFHLAMFNALFKFHVDPGNRSGHGCT